ncbi:MAG TPA: hydroxyethylthiazole kinase [Candidatus Binatia bacterium]|nr:hydroxyethylthiazole kinase [Candidatus Binatia bacterium]
MASTPTLRFSPAASLSAIRAAPPLIHQITNYVVMNETANLTLAIGASPVMAHALGEVEEMASVASALVLNIGTLSPEWVEAMVLAGRAANRHGAPVVLDPVGAGATRLRTEAARRILGEVSIAIVRGNAAELAALAGESAEIRGVDSLSSAEPGELARRASRALGCTVAVTGPVDHVAGPGGRVAVSNGVPMLGRVTGTGCMASAMCGCFAAVNPDDPLRAAAEALAAFGVAAEHALAGARGPGSFHVNLYDCVAGLDPETLDQEAHIEWSDRGGAASGGRSEAGP